MDREAVMPWCMAVAEVVVIRVTIVSTIAVIGTSAGMGTTMGHSS